MALSISQALNQLSQQPCEAGTMIITPIFQVGKLRHREGKSLAHGLTLGEVTEL